METIEHIEVVSIKDSRGKDTLCVSVKSGKHVGTFSVPSGASTGLYEVYELRDVDGGMKAACSIVQEKITPLLIGLSPYDQLGIDTLLYGLDSNPQKKTIGGNTILAVSGAIAQLGASLRGIPLYQYLREVFPDAQRGGFVQPRCYFNLINGGKHAHTMLAFQEYHIVPQTLTTYESLIMAKAIYSALHVCVAETYGVVPLGDEGGYALPCEDVEVPLALLRTAVARAGYTEGKDVVYALDVAASSFFEAEKYNYNGGLHTSTELLETYKVLCKKYPILSIEDPYAEQSIQDFIQARDVLTGVTIIGDDLTVTQRDRFVFAEESGAIDGLIIKPNQVGTISETVRTISEAHARKKQCIVSHRSGETMDDSIADIAVAFGCFGIKTGAPGPKERMVKYDRLVAITSNHE